MESLEHLLITMPKGTDWKAHRYDTDDEHVLHLWNDNGKSIDLRVKKTVIVNYIPDELIEKRTDATKK